MHGIVKFVALATLLPAAEAQLANTAPVPGAIKSSGLQTLADMNGDGLLDVVVKDQAPNASTIGFLPATGPRSYGFLQPLIPEFDPFQVGSFLPTDHDGDGDQDLWVSRFDGTAVLSLYLNQGQLPLVLSAEYVLPFGPLDFQMIDVNGDGIRDIHLDFGDFNAGFLPGQANGTYLPLQTYLPPAFQHGPLLIGDLDGDGDADLMGLRAETSGSPQFLAYSFENTGSFPLDPATGVPLTTPARFGSLSDLDADGDLDGLLILKPGMSAILFENTGGSLAEVGPLVDGLTIFQEFLITDADGDGNEDVLYPAGNDLAWRAGGPGLSFAPPALLAQDEGLPRLGTPQPGSGLAQLLFSGTVLGVFGPDYFRFAEFQSGVLGLEPDLLLLSDLPGLATPTVFDPDGNGIEDLLLILDDKLVWKRAIGSGGYDIIRHIVDVAPGTIQPVAGDFDGDGHEDVVYSESGIQELRFLRGDGSGRFAAVPALTPLPSVPTSLHSADVDSDGVPDVLVTTLGGTSVSAWLGASSGVFGPEIPVASGFTVPVVPVPLDANADGLTDFVVANGKFVELVVQSAAGGFQPPTVVADATPFLLGSDVLLPPAVGDLDLDGRTDLVVTATSTIHSAAGLGGGAFGPLALVHEVPLTSLLDTKLLPIDPGGAVDILTLLASGSRLQWSSNLGGFQFGPLKTPLGSLVSDDSAPQSIHLVDVDGDGDQDILSTSGSRSYLTTNNLSNDSLGTAYCTPAVANSTGQPGVIGALGSSDPGQNQFTLTASDLPFGGFGFFLVSATQDLVSSVPNSAGSLCLGGAIGRFNRPFEVQAIDSAGMIFLEVDLTSMPSPSGDFAVLPGQTWNFQAWYRDLNGPTGTLSNFSDALEVQF